MAQEKRIFVGGMDFDTESRHIQPGEYRAAINMKPSGENDSLGTMENIVGSEHISLASAITYSGATKGSASIATKVDSGAKVIGKYRDEVLDRIIYFVQNDTTAKDLILEYSQKENAISLIAETDLFLFDANHLITSVNVVGHGEDYAPEGMIYWTDDKNEPRKINIAKAKILSGSADIASGKYYSSLYPSGYDTDLTGGYTAFTAQILNAIKRPPSKSTPIIIGSNSNMLSNNISNNVWQFCYRYVYDDKEKSAFSFHSESITTSVGTAYDDSKTNSDNYIEVEFNSGSKEVEAIEIAVRNPADRTDFFIVKTIEKNTTKKVSSVYSASNASDDGTDLTTTVSSDNTSFYYRFYNNEVRRALDIKEALKPFDDIPLKAKSQEVIDGNRLVYADVVNGRDGVESEVALSYAEVAAPASGASSNPALTVSTSADMYYWKGMVATNTVAYPAVQFKVAIDISSLIASSDDVSFNLNLNDFGVFFHGSKAGTLVNNQEANFFGKIDFNETVNGSVGSIGQDIANNLNATLPSSGAINNILTTYSTTNAAYDGGVLPVNTTAGGSQTSGGYDNANPISGAINGSPVTNPSNFANGYAAGLCSGNLFTFNSSTNKIELKFAVVATVDCWSNAGQKVWMSGIGADLTALGSLNSVSYSSVLNSIGTYTTFGSYNPTTPDYKGSELFYTVPAANLITSTSGYTQLVFTNPATANSWKTGVNHSFGVVYYDSDNRQSSVVDCGSIYVPTHVEMTTPGSKISISYAIKHLPPSWAKKYQFVVSNSRNIAMFNQTRIKDVIDGGDTVLPQAFTDKYKDFLLIDISEIYKAADVTNETTSYYDFVLGDRIRFLRVPTGLSAATDKLDYKISSVVTGDPGLYTGFTGTYIAINKSELTGYTTFNNLIGEFLEIYRPGKEFENDEVFYYEFGEEFDIVGGYHYGGTQNQTSGQDATGTFSKGDVYARYVPRYTSAILDYIESYSYSDFFRSDHFGQGRAQAINKDFKETRRPATAFYSDPLIPNTNINGLSSIFPDDYYEEFDKSYGSIQKLHSRENQLIIFQEDKVSRAQVNRNIITTGDGNQILTAQGAVISQAIPYSGEYGISKNPESFAEYGETLYFTDMRRGVVCRLSQNGIFPISNYKMKNYFSDLFRILSRWPGLSPRIYGAFNPKDGEYMITLDTDDWSTVFSGAASTNLEKEAREGYFFDNFGIRNTYSSNTQAKYITNLKKADLAKKTIVFSEGSNRWTYFIDIFGMQEYLNSEVVMFSNKHTSAGNSCATGGDHDGAILYVTRREVFDANYNPNNYSKIYTQETNSGSSGISESTLLFIGNIEPSQNKIYNSIGVESSSKPDGMEIQNNYRQYSLLKALHFDTRENMHYSAIYGDINSFSAYDASNALAGMINGEKLRSTDVMVKLNWSNSSYLRLYAANLGFTLSNKSGVS